MGNDTRTDDPAALAAWEIDVDNLRGLDKLIRDDEADANRIRWRYGRAMLASRGDRQRLPKGALHALKTATGNSRRELQYRMAFADKFPTEADMCTVLHLSWHEIIGAHLTSRAEQPDDDDQPKPERSGNVLDGFTVMRADDGVKELKTWEHKVFRKDAVASYSPDERAEMIRWLKRIADRLQRGG
jgi:hypothetical protein